MVKKLKDVTLDFVPYSEIRDLESGERIRKLLGVVLKNQIIILQGRLRPEEETRLIEDTMAMIGHVKNFKGIELAVINSEENISVFRKFKEGIARFLIGGDVSSMTIIGPASVVKEIKKNPKKIELLLKR